MINLLEMFAYIEIAAYLFHINSYFENQLKSNVIENNSKIKFKHFFENL